VDVLDPHDLRRSPSALRELSFKQAEQFRRPISGFHNLALQLPFPQVSESMGNHDSKIVDAGSVN